MTDLSPAAQIAIEAWWNASDGEYINGVWTPNRSAQLAAALEAVADQVVPENAEAVGDKHDDARADQWMRIRYKLLAIAAELRGTNPTNQED